MYENQLTSRFTRSRCQRISLLAQTHSLISDLVEAFHWKIYMAKMPTVCIFSAERIFILNGIFLNSLRARPVSCENFPVFLECNRQIDVLSVRVQHGGKSILPYNNIFAFTHTNTHIHIGIHPYKRIVERKSHKSHTLAHHSMKMGNNNKYPSKCAILLLAPELATKWLRGFVQRAHSQQIKPFLWYAVYVSGEVESSIGN